MTRTVLGLLGILGALAAIAPPREALSLIAQVKGMDLAAASNAVAADVKVEGRLFLPERVGRVRAVITTMFWGLGDEVYADPEVRGLAEATDSALLLARVSPVLATGVNNRPVFTDAGIQALLTVFRRLADDSGHPELESAPLVFWAHSAAGNFSAAFAMRHPERTAAVILYQSAAAGVVRSETDIGRLAPTPTLIIEGIVDPKFDATSSEGLLKRGRALGAPWAFVHQRDAPHGSEAHRKVANDLVVSWTAAVLRQRIPEVGKSLVPVSASAGWIGINETGAVVEAKLMSSTPSAVTSWLPDETSANSWRSLTRPAR